MARRGSTRPSPPSGTECWCNAARFTSTETCSHIYIGWLFLFSGLLGLVTIFSARDASAFFWILLTSALSLAVGILLIWKPDEGTVSLMLVPTAFFIAEGAFQVGTSIS
jgi:uncharacterized membrane protein HdeD (DUF308 family)